LEKSLIERVIRYFKDKTESFYDYYPSISKKKNIIVIYNMYTIG